MHPEKTKIVYCKNAKRQGDHPNVTFDFLGFAFRPRLVKNTQNGSQFCGFNPAVSPSALAAMRSTIRDLNLRRRTHVSMAGIAQVPNPLLRGWIGYYGRYAPSALRSLLQHVNKTLLSWLRRKFKRFNQHKTQAGRFLERLARDSADLFVHWPLGVTSGFV